MRYLLLSISILFFSLPAFGQNEHQDPYHTLYGDGLRHYAEGRYDEALKNLYRAWAVRESPTVLKLIVRSHDFIGHCTAAERQLGLFIELFPSEQPPILQDCLMSGELVIECSPHAGEVVIDHSIRASCGSTIKMPPGLHHIQSPSLNQTETFEVIVDQTTIARLELNPEKWVRSRAHLRSGEPRKEIVIQTRDGDVRIWLESNLRRDPDMDRESPGFTIVDERRHRDYEIPSLSP